MANDQLTNPGRRLLLLSLAAAPAACSITALQPPEGTALAATPVPRPVRLPQVGQEWVYAVHNVYNGERLSVLTERVVEVGERIRIERIDDRKGLLTEEVHDRWGYILQDPHWDPAQRYDRGIPLWPPTLESGAKQQFNARYIVPGHPDFAYHWGQLIRVGQWMAIDTPAGRFQTLKFENLIEYQHVEHTFRASSQRMESIWFAPEIGRWAVRRSTGVYYVPSDRGSGAMHDDFFEWRLLSWK